MKKFKYTVLIVCGILLGLLGLGCSKTTPDKFTQLHQKNYLENVMKSKDSIDVTMYYTTPSGEKSNRVFYIENTKNSYNIYEELSSTEKVYFFDEKVYYGNYQVCYADAPYKDIISPYFEIQQGFTGFNYGAYLYENISPYQEEMWYFAESFLGEESVEEQDGTKVHTVEIKDDKNANAILEKAGYKDSQTVIVVFTEDQDGYLQSAKLSYKNSKDETTDIFSKEYTYNAKKEYFSQWKDIDKDKAIHQLTIYKDNQTQNESSRKIQVPDGVNVILTSLNGDLSFYYDSFHSMPINYGTGLKLSGDSFVFCEKGQRQTNGGVFGIIGNKVGIFENAFPGITGKLSYIESLLEGYFYKDYDKDKIELAIMKAIISNLDDKYAEYYTPEEYKKQMEEDEGSFVGIGIVVSKINDEFVVTWVYDDSPAQKANLQVADKIVKVDDKESEGLELSELVALLRGDDGTVVNITVKRGADLVTLPVTRGTIESDTVDYFISDNGIGYIEISGFERVTEEQFKKALLEMKDKGAKGIIFDLRNNPGGLMTVVGSMLDMITPNGELFTSKTRLAGELKNEATGNAILTVPFICLVNKKTASAAELFSGSLQANGLATVIGETTYGKGVVQSTFNLPDGSGIKFTVGEYNLPGGKNIHEVGVIPDISIGLPSGVGTVIRTGPNDTQYSRALEEMSKKLS